jgi:hypothetical protein
MRSWRWTLADRFYSNQVVGQSTRGGTSVAFHNLGLTLEVVDHHIGVEDEMLCGEQ